MPATIGPAMKAVLCDRLSRALPCCSRSADTVCGINPVAAGPKNAEAVPLAAEATTKTHSSAVPLSTATASPSWAPARTRSAPTMSSRRGSRSAQTPPTRRKTTRGSMNAARTKPRSAADPLTARTAKVRATAVSESPAADVVWPIQSRRKLISCRGPKRACIGPVQSFRLNQSCLTSNNLSSNYTTCQACR